MARTQPHQTPGAPRQGHADDGFSLLELMIVVVILSILTLTVLPRIIDRPDQARVVRAQSDIAAIESAVRMYRLDTTVYPDTEQGLRALVERPTGADSPDNWSGYLDRLPEDPWGQPYQYLYPGLHGDFDVFSLGADRAPGGDGIDADIGGWMAR
jgi:general secretion pathway protein G